MPTLDLFVGINSAPPVMMELAFFFLFVFFLTFLIIKVLLFPLHAASTPNVLQEQPFQGFLVKTAIQNVN